MTPGTVLSILFLACAAVCWANVRALLRDRTVAGISLFPTWVFLTTNLYEVWFFFDLQQNWALVGSVAMAVVNMVWLGIAYFYRWQDSVVSEIEKTLDLQG